MKKVLLATALLAVSAAPAFAAKSIVNSKHNLSSSGTGIFSTTQSQICIFCHTPHNAVRNVPLWNRNDPGTTYQLYTSSNTLTDATKAAALNADSYSIFCLSCHDGSLAEIGSRVNRKGGNAFTMYDRDGSWKTSGLTQNGKSLTDDHPIGFNYVTAQSQNTAYLNVKDDVNLALTGSVSNTVFYKSTAGAGSDSMECSSCHVVHDNTNSPFLRTSNAGSALCLACHNK